MTFRNLDWINLIGLVVFSIPKLIINNNCRGGGGGGGGTSLVPDGE